MARNLLLCVSIHINIINSIVMELTHIILIFIIVINLNIKFNYKLYMFLSSLHYNYYSIEIK